ncbi:MurR/RpiR family transcriptional regulator [Aquincola tertiaricarbonis]|uniref:MurR/RpiR family transcriptional regulator n=1 Tax=Aquincola tertiaricarbonis TaxID=391953 RepID=A0ABY4S0P0_AQUTE|nr:MurR/RpiR family transcriptional regulator [Aquincola tertiaricarbonis]URI06923.1 MurR/RpiR family transcriptional regulator [Aquincola tertiaricarbonis]
MRSPPATLAAPSDWAGRFAALPVLQQVAACLPGMPAALQRMGQAVLAHPFRAATLNIDEFAGEVSVSVATANRFARALNYPGYPQFRAELARGFEAILAPVESLRSNLRQGASTQQAMAGSLTETLGNLQHTVQALQHQPCDAAVKLLTEAEQVMTLGWGSSAYLAGLLQHELEPYCARVSSLAHSGGPSHAARQLVKRGPRDVVVALAFPRYVEDTIVLTRLARERGVKVLALTDEPTSPLVPLADVVLYAHVNRQVASTSNATVLALLEALVAAVVHHTPDAVQRAEDMASGVLPWLQIDTGRPAAAPALRRAARPRKDTE